MCVGQCVCVVLYLLSTMTSDRAQVHTVLSQHEGCGRASADGKVLDTLGMTLKHYIHASSLGHCSAARVSAQFLYTVFSVFTSCLMCRMMSHVLLVKAPHNHDVVRRYTHFKTRHDFIPIRHGTQAHHEAG